MKRITVCVPSYDRSSSLADCLESVLSQDYDGWKLVVSDDASADESGELVRAYNGCTPDVRVSLRTQPVGYAQNVNQMLEDAETDYVTVLAPCDRYVRPDFLERAVAKLDSDSGLALVHCAFSELDHDGHERRTVRQHEHPVSMSGADLRLAMLRFRLPQFSTVVVRRSVIERAGLMATDYQRATEVGWMFALAGQGDVHYDSVAGIGHPMEGVPGSTLVSETATIARRRDVLRVVRNHCENHQALRVAWETSRQLLETPAPFSAPPSAGRKLELFLTEGQELDRSVVVFSDSSSASDLLGSTEMAGQITALAGMDPDFQGTEVDGVPVLDPEAVLTSGANAVVLSSKAQHAQLEKWLREKLPEGTEIVKLWE